MFFSLFQFQIFHQWRLQMLNFDALSEGSLGPPMTKPWSVLSHRTKISLNRRFVGRRSAQKNRRSISPEGSPWIYEKSHQAQPSSSSEQSHQATLGFLRKKNKKDINLTIYSHGSCWVCVLIITVYENCRKSVSVIV